MDMSWSFATQVSESLDWNDGWNDDVCPYAIVAALLFTHCTVPMMTLIIMQLASSDDLKESFVDKLWPDIADCCRCLHDQSRASQVDVIVSLALSLLLWLAAKTSFTWMSQRRQEMRDNSTKDPRDSYKNIKGRESISLEHYSSAVLCFSASLLAELLRPINEPTLIFDRRRFVSCK